MSRRREILVAAAIAFAALVILIILIVQAIGATIMKRLAVLAAVAVALSACTSLPGTGGSNFDLNAFLNSTTCAHDDSVKGVTGAAGIPASLQFEASRHCPAVPAAAPEPPK